MIGILILISPAPCIPANSVKSTKSIPKRDFIFLYNITHVALSKINKALNAAKI